MPRDAVTLADALRANARELLTVAIAPEVFREKHRELWREVEAAGVNVREDVLRSLRGESANI